MDDYYNRIVAFLNEYYGDLTRVHIDELFGTSHNSLKLEDLTPGYSGLTYDAHLKLCLRTIFLIIYFLF